MPYADPVKKRESRRRWRLANPEKVKEMDRKRRLRRDKTKLKAIQHAWYLKNKEKCLEGQRQRRKDVGPDYYKNRYLKWDKKHGFKKRWGEFAEARLAWNDLWKEYAEKPEFQQSEHHKRMKKDKKYHKKIKDLKLKKKGNQNDNETR